MASKKEKSQPQRNPVTNRPLPNRTTTIEEDKREDPTERDTVSAEQSEQQT